MWLTSLLGIVIGVAFLRCELQKCHDDPNLLLDDGPLLEYQFTWLGTLQYIHVKNGTPHYFRTPRVVLISPLFILSTAMDAANVPEGYALGNIAFGEYERDEEECGVTIQQLSNGAECAPAALFVPIADVLLHPEYKHFGATESIALLKLITPIKSAYMVPVCLPYTDYLTDVQGRASNAEIWHIDYSTDVPRDIIDEDKEVTRLFQLPKELCYLYDDTTENATERATDRIICTTGCGLHSGAPSVIHEPTGHWSVAALSQGGSPCRDPLRRRRPPSPPRHIVLHSYVPWITKAITGQSTRSFAKDDPFGFIMPRGSMVYNVSEDGWVGHWWVAGIRCYDRGKDADDLFRFYHEIFRIKPVPKSPTNVSYYLELNSAHNRLIVCVKVGMPFRVGSPRIWSLGTTNVKLYIPMTHINVDYKFQVEGWAQRRLPVTDPPSADSNSSSVY